MCYAPTPPVNASGHGHWRSSKPTEGAGKPIGPDIVSACVPGLSRDDAGKYLRRLAAEELLTKLSRGLFEYPATPTAPIGRWLECP